jgi:hypothetical protein
MSEEIQISYGLIVDGVIVDTYTFDPEFDDSILEFIRVEKNADEVVLLPEGIGIGGLLKNGNFIPPKPKPSFVLNENDEWVPPLPKPEGPGFYAWSEPTQTWDLVPENHEDIPFMPVETE